MKMRKRNGLLASTAAAALLVGSMAAFAQSGVSPSERQPAPGASQGEQRAQPQRGAGERSPERGRSSQRGAGAADENLGQGPQRSQRGEQQQRGAEERGQRGRGGQTTRQPTQDRGAATENRQQRAQDRERTRRRGAQTRDRDENRGQAQGAEREERQQRPGRTGTTQRETQGERFDRREDRTTRDQSRTQGSVSLSTDQETRVRSVIERQSARATANVDFDVRVGAPVPSRVRLQTLPSSVVQIVPQYSGYRYAIVQDEIVIIHPRTRKVVTVISQSQTTGARSPAQGRLSLTAEQRRLIRRHATFHASPPADVVLRVGAELPESVELGAFSDEVYSEVPALRRYRYFVTNDGVVLVDPDANEIVEVIED